LAIVAPSAKVFPIRSRASSISFSSRCVNRQSPLSNIPQFSSKIASFSTPGMRMIPGCDRAYFTTRRALSITPPERGFHGGNAHLPAKSVFDKSGPSRKSGEARPALREIEANSPFYLTKSHADLDRFHRFCSRFTTFQTRSKGPRNNNPSSFGAGASRLTALLVIRPRPGGSPFGRTSGASDSAIVRNRRSNTSAYSPSSRLAGRAARRPSLRNLFLHGPLESPVLRSAAFQPGPAGSAW
jgi:hypothetical protein